MLAFGRALMSSPKPGPPAGGGGSARPGTALGDHVPPVRCGTAQGPEVSVIMRIRASTPTVFHDHGTNLYTRVPKGSGIMANRWFGQREHHDASIGKVIGPGVRDPLGSMPVILDDSSVI
ncbi:hypothetical protein [Dactylosporangium sp. CA-092794]|uniref:hypothetical protein n=1 Tax=Dactylosporangium sp. CA-092794 TaxID=3239929 RepID=UPI003D89E46B